MNHVGHQKIELNEQSYFYRLIHKVAARLVSAQGEEIDAAMADGLALIGDYFDASLVGLGQIARSGELMPALCAWGKHPSPHYLAADPPGPELVARYSREGSLVWNQLQDLDELPQFREHCRQVGALAGVFWLHREFENHVEGIAVGSQEAKIWPKDIVERLGVIGDVFYNALYRQRADTELLLAFEEIRKLKDHLQAENIVLREKIKVSRTDSELIGKSHAFRTVLHQVKQVGHTDSTVLLLGETGTGKGIIARQIHQHSARSDLPIVTVNCAALPSTLIESELFGHEKGAFTGAIARKIGRFELADGGTIFLDEVGDLPLELQAKLLRVLQDHEFERLGSSNTITINTRVIAATNRNLGKLIEEGTFRADLYYRLSVFPIRLASLCERRDDIPLLVWYFITDLQKRLGKTFNTVPTWVMDALISYDWPGNVRELRNVIERAMILSPGPTLELHGVLPVRRAGKGTPVRTREPAGSSLEEAERAHIVGVLEDCNWKVRGQDGAAERLGLKRTTLQSRMKKLKIIRPTDST